MNEGFRRLEGFARDVSAEGAAFKILSEDIGVLHVLEKERWNNNISQLSKHFWPVIGEGHPERVPFREDWLRSVYADAEDVYMCFGREGPIGTACAQRHPNDGDVQIVRDITVNRGARKARIGKRLFETLVVGAPRGTKGYVGIASNPAAIRTYSLVAKSLGFGFSWGKIQPGEEELYARGHEYVEKEGHATGERRGDNPGLVFVKKGVLPVMSAPSAVHAKHRQDMQQFSDTLNSIRVLQDRYGGDKKHAETVVGALFVMYPKRPDEAQPTA